ncbi:MAG: BolA family transcriptional regulator [Leptospira sp.]|nr:BolA family transcriptional regulator [Leptospira sp.]NCS94958.1 BolA family transcriptional regulator [Leptospira sp.]
MRTTRIKEILTAAFSPSKIEIVDFTNDHRGHSGQGGGNETHIRVSIGGEFFEDLTLLESHRRIQDCLKDEFTSGMHALEIHILK